VSPVVPDVAPAEGAHRGQLQGRAYTDNPDNQLAVGAVAVIPQWRDELTQLEESYRPLLS